MSRRTIPCLSVSLLVTAALVAVAQASVGSGKLRAPSIFGTNMVLQRQVPLRIWGWGTPGRTVTVTLAGQRAKTRVAPDGSWSVTLKPLEAGGPHQAVVTDGLDTLRWENVLVGEVWLCSGQSNMEMPLAGWPPRDTLLNSAEEIRAAHFPSIRLFKVPRKVAAEPQPDCSGQWVPCEPEAAANFSAAAYFFGRELYRKLNVPIGLVESTWGGTPAEAWTSREALAEFPEFAEILQNFEKLAETTRELQAWLTRFPSIDLGSIDEKRFWAGYEHGDPRLASPETPDSTWLALQVPQAWERTSLGEFDGIVWFRKWVELPASWSGTDLTLSLGPIDDMDRVYFNGEKIGGYEQPGYWSVERTFTVPSRLVRAGRNLIAVRVIDLRGGGGIYGRPEQLYLSPTGKPEERISLAGSWQVLPVAEIQGSRLFLYQDDKSYGERPRLPIAFGSRTPAVLYNGMIHPLVGYGIRGVIWYQGESNVGRAEQYARLFPAMIRDWRSRWGLGNFPFYFVQIAPYNYGNGLSPFLREAQLLTYRRVENTGIVVTTDISDPSTIHPANKQEVGRRLALWALAKTYGFRDLIPSGPLYREMKLEGSRVRLFFDFVGSALVARGDKLMGFEIAGPDRVFRPAMARIEGLTVVVWHPEVPEPAAVRFGWSDTAQPNLFNSEGLPASPFRTDNWER
ncbi:MAG: hypothetical protein ONB23_10415 [candidate division KSB1 bacterium]|nr:hypothetical protein [candidate division KSB1 bacterium]